MDNNIHSHTHVMDEKWILILNINRYISDKLCRQLVEIEKPSPPPLQSSISMEILQDNGKLGKRSNVCSKGQMDAYSSISK